MKPTTRARGRKRALLVAAMAVVVAAACGDDAGPQAITQPENPVATDEAEPGLSVQVVSEPGEGDESTETVVLRAVVDYEGSGSMLPTSFEAELRFSPALAPVSEVEPEEADDATLRVVNLEADGGLIKAAGAAPDGFATSTLFAVEMRVKSTDWPEAVEFDLQELTVVENNFADVTDKVKVTEILPDRPGDGDDRPTPEMPKPEGNRP